MAENKDNKNTNLFEDGVTLLQPSTKENAIKSIRRLKNIFIFLCIFCALFGFIILVGNPGLGFGLIGVAFICGVFNIIMTWLSVFFCELQDIADIQRFTLHVMLIEKKDYLESIETRSSPENDTQADKE